jgi:DHA1 family tetracycline resistance protein-like MFS transporter
VLTYVGVLSVIMQGFLVGRLASRYREDLLIAVSVVVMSVALIGWAWAPSVLWLYIITAPIALAGGLLNTLLSSILTKAVESQEIGGILGLSAAVESSTRIIAPILGGVLLQQVGTWAPGAFGAVLMIGVSIYVYIKIYNHPIVAAFKENQAAPVPLSD